MSCPVYTLMSKTAQSLEGGGKQSNNQTKDYIVANHKFYERKTFMLKIKDLAPPPINKIEL